MEYLVLYNIETNEEVNRIELKAVRNISVMKGKKINEIAWSYGSHTDDFKDYIMVQFDSKHGDIGFILCEKSEGYISFE